VLSRPITRPNPSPDVNLFGPVIFFDWNWKICMLLILLAFNTLSHFTDESERSRSLDMQSPWHAISSSSARSMSSSSQLVVPIPIPGTPDTEIPPRGWPGPKLRVLASCVAFWQLSNWKFIKGQLNMQMLKAQKSRRKAPPLLAAIWLGSANIDQQLGRWKKWKISYVHMLLDGDKK